MTCGFRRILLMLVIGTTAGWGCSQTTPPGYHVVTEESLTPRDSSINGNADVPPPPAEQLSQPSPESDRDESGSRPAEANPQLSVDMEQDSRPTPATRDKGLPYDLSQLTAEQQMAVLRAQALGEPLPDFTKLEEPREIKLLIPEKEFSVEGPENLIRISFDDIDLLKVLNMEPVPANAMDYFPEWLKSLDGKRVILRGWMFPPGRTDNISKFMFVRDNGICCFQRKPKVYDKLGVTMREGLTTHYIEGRPFDVVATLRFAPDVIEGDELFWLYFLEDAIVIDSKS